MKFISSAFSFRDVLPSALLILLFGVFLSWFYSPWQWLGSLAWMAIPCGILLGVAIYLLGFIVSCSKWTKTRSMHQLLESLHQLFQYFTWPQVVIVSILAGVGEELLIRGVLQTFLVESAGSLWGIICASLIFGLLHFMTKTYVLLTFALGVLFGIAFHYSDSIILVMIAHTVYDIIAFAMIVKFPHTLGLHLEDAKTIIVRERHH